MSVVKRGYCVDCLTNHRHIHRIRSTPLRILDIATLRFATYFRIGSWHCEVCNRKSILLRGQRHEEENVPAQVDPVEQGEPVESMDDPNQSVGNFIRRDFDLVAQADRLQRFSQKFRESIIERLMTGQVDVAGVRQELNVQERDLFAMVREKVRRLESHIESLEYQILELSAGELVGNSFEHPHIFNAEIDGTNSDRSVQKVGP